MWFLIPTLFSSHNNYLFQPLGLKLKLSDSLLQLKHLLLMNSSVSLLALEKIRYIVLCLLKLRFELIVILPELSVHRLLARHF